MKYSPFILTLLALSLAACAPGKKDSDSFANELKLKDYQPVSIFKLPEHHPEQAKFAVIDMHSHPYAETDAEIQEWVKTAKKNNVEHIIINTYAHGEAFDKLYDQYKGIDPDLFELWCGFDLDHFDEPGFEDAAVAELVRCWEKGARGVGELGDKGLGESYCRRSSTGKPMPTGHLDDPRFDALFEKCGELGMPISIHEGDPIWMYEPMDEHNDGYMNADYWKIDLSTPGILDLDGVVATLERCMEKHRKTVFIACHLLNYSHDYETLSAIMDRHPNLWLDNSARHLETCVTPRATKAFYEKYPDRILFGTDNTPTDRLYMLEWRILETEDEHFYAGGSYHWPLHGIGLSDEVLQKVYHDNAAQLFKQLGR